jgi:hypothetical protein
MLADRQPSAMRRTGSIARSRHGNTQRYNAVATTVDDAGRHRVTAASLHWMTVAMALLAGTIFVLADADGGRSRASIAIQLSVEVALVTLGTLIVRRRLAASNETPLIMPLLILVVVTSLLWEPFQRMFLLSGRPFEMMVMHTQKNLNAGCSGSGLSDWLSANVDPRRCRSDHFLCGDSETESGFMADRYLWLRRCELDGGRILGQSSWPTVCRDIHVIFLCAG